MLRRTDLEEEVRRYCNPGWRRLPVDHVPDEINMASNATLYGMRDRFRRLEREQRAALVEQIGHLGEPVL